MTKETLALVRDLAQLAIEHEIYRERLTVIIKGFVTDPSCGLSHDELALALAGNKISVIKSFRARTNTSLLEAKTAVEKAMGEFK